MIEPRANPHLFGHAAAEALLAEAMRTGRMHHAWLITGDAGIGKATLAFRAARRLLAGPPAGDTLALDPAETAFRRAATGSHADLLTVERAWDDKRKKLRSEIVVDDVRAVAGFLHLTPAEGGWRVVVLDSAEEMNRNGANALLKMLEEPPPRSVLFLTCTAPGRLLPTIRSRCRQLRLQALGGAEMARALELVLPELSASERERLSILADGSPGRAIQLAAGGATSAAGLVRKVLDADLLLSTEQAHALADELGRGEDAFGTFMELLRGEVAGLVRNAARGHPQRALRSRPLDAWVEVWQALGGLRAETEGAYLDKRQAVIAGLEMLAGRVA